VLTDKAIRNAKPAAKPYKMADGSGMYLLVNPNGGKWWRLKYRFSGKENSLSLGTYPDTSLKQARERRDAARKQIEAGIDPSAHRKIEKAKRGSDTFEGIAREWLEKFSGSWAESHAETVERRLERDVFPWLGNRPAGEITAPELLAVLRRIEARGALETAHRVKQLCGQVFRYAVATGRAERDPSNDLRGALPPVKEKHHAALTRPADVGALLRAIEGYKGSFVVRCALRLAPLVFVRPGELRKAEWSEFDLDGATWRIPSSRMKMRREHIVPLSRQAVEILCELHPLTGAGRYVFPSARTTLRPMSEVAVLAALRRMNYSRDEMTGHGFRTIASTMLNELGFPSDAIERQLAHGEPNAVRDAYNRAEHLAARCAMMQQWADYLDNLASGARARFRSGQPPDGCDLFRSWCPPLNPSCYCLAL